MKNFEPINNIFSCRICGTTSNPIEYFKKFDLFRCAECGTVQVINLPPEDFTLKYYADYIDTYTAGMKKGRYACEMKKRHASKLAFMRRFISSGDLLDIGCGEGWFIEQAISNGYNAIGCDYAKRTDYPPNVKVIKGNLNTIGGLPFKNCSFDVVTSWAVIEHIRNPHTAIAEIFRILRPGGLFFCDTPLCGDITEQWVAARSHWFCPPEYLHIFSYKSLSHLIRLKGFNIIFSTPSFERNIIRLIARRSRNFIVGTIAGHVMYKVNKQEWIRRRNDSVTQIGDIQLLVALKNN